MAESRSLRPLGGWDLVARGRFRVRHGGHVWTVDLDYFDVRERLSLYRDGVRVEVQSSPATFVLEDGATILASMSLLGMRQVDLVVEGQTTPLLPVDGTAEAWRFRLERERPVLSRLIGVISWTVLVLALVYEVPQVIALLGGAVGADVDPPLTLPGAVNTALGLLALAAALERALRFKSSRWLG